MKSLFRKMFKRDLNKVKANQNPISKNLSVKEEKEVLLKLIDCLEKEENPSSILSVQARHSFFANALIIVQCFEDGEEVNQIRKLITGEWGEVIRFKHRLNFTPLYR